MEELRSQTMGGNRSKGTATAGSHCRLWSGGQRPRRGGTRAIGGRQKASVGLAAWWELDARGDARDAALGREGGSGRNHLRNSCSGSPRIRNRAAEPHVACEGGSSESNLAASGPCVWCRGNPWLPRNLPVATSPAIRYSVRAQWLRVPCSSC